MHFTHHSSWLVLNCSSCQVRGGHMALSGIQYVLICHCVAEMHQDTLCNTCSFYKDHLCNRKCVLASTFHLGLKGHFFSLNPSTIIFLLPSSSTLLKTIYMVLHHFIFLSNKEGEMDSPILSCLVHWAAVVSKWLPWHDDNIGQPVAAPLGERDIQ